MDLLSALECDRKALGLSQDQMARALGMSQAWYSKVVNRKERCSRRFANFVELCYRRAPDKYPFLETFFLCQGDYPGDSPNAEANDGQGIRVPGNTVSDCPAGDADSNVGGDEVARGVVR